MLNRFANNYNTLVLGSPRIVLALLALLFVFFAYHAKDFKLDASADSLLLENDKDLRVFREVNDRYETKEFLFVTFTPDEDLFSEEELGEIEMEDKKAVEDIRRNAWDEYKAPILGEAQDFYDILDELSLSSGEREGLEAIKNKLK